MKVVIFQDKETNKWYCIAGDNIPDIRERFKNIFYYETEDLYDLLNELMEYKDFEYPRILLTDDEGNIPDLFSL